MDRVHEFSKRDACAPRRIQRRGSLLFVFENVNYNNRIDTANCPFGFSSSAYPRVNLVLSARSAQPKPCFCQRNGSARNAGNRRIASKEIFFFAKRAKWNERTAESTGVSKYQLGFPKDLFQEAVFATLGDRCL